MFSSQPPGRGVDPTPTKQQASAMAAKALPVELVEEVLLRFPPDDPASLVHAALVSKRWCRLICGRGFQRRFREIHGAPPLLGFVCLRAGSARSTDRLFVPSPTSSFKPRHHGDPRFRCMEAVHSCHGRVLLRSSPGGAVPAPEEDLFVWDPIADELRKLPRWPLYSPYSCDSGNAAVLCAGTVAADGCDHLDCHRGPFVVVFVGPDRNGRTFLCVYSSEAGRWSNPVYVEQRECYYGKENSVLIGTAVYFKMSPDVPAVLKYDLLTRELSWITIPIQGVLQKLFHMLATLLVMEGGRLGFAFIELTSEMNKLHLWSMDHGPDEDARWESRVIDLDNLLPTQVGRPTNVVGFADTGAGGVIIFIWSCDDDRLFSLNLKSGSTEVVQESFGVNQAVPYMSFCTPALGAVSTEEGPGAGEQSA